MLKMASDNLLLVIDFMNDIVHKDSPTAKSAENVERFNTISHANKAIAAARSAQVPIVFVKVAFDANYLTCPANSPVFSPAAEHKKFMLDTWGTEFHQDLDVQENDFVLVKHRISAFYKTELDVILRANNIKNVYISGVSTSFTVSATSRDLHDRDYNVFVIEDACMDANLDHHKYELEILSRFTKLVTSDKVFLA